MTEPIRENTTETFEQKLARSEGVDKDFAQNLAENWQKILGAMGIVLLSVWVVNEYRAAKEKRIGEASTRFSQIQNTFGESIGGAVEQADLEKKSKVIKDNIKTLNDTFNGTSYSELTSLYDGLLLKQQGKFSEAEAVLKNLSSMPSVQDFSLNDLNKEVSSLALARNMLAEGRTDEAQKFLEGLVNNSKIVNVEALLILARTSESGVAKIAAELKSSRPEFADLIDREMANFGIDLEVK